jgi:ketosteroid isomerase-like protein
MFRDLIPLLADRFHVIAPDYIGFGQSDAPDHSSFTYSFDNLTVLSIGRFRGVHGATGKSVDAAYAHLWMVRDGQITRFRQFIDTLAIAQAGL